MYYTGYDTEVKITIRKYFLSTANSKCPLKNYLDFGTNSGIESSIFQVTESDSSYTVIINLSEKGFAGEYSLTLRAESFLGRYTYIYYITLETCIYL